jgi:hypothetical protein
MVAARRNLAQFAKAIHLQAGAVPVYAAYDNPELAWYYGEGVPALPESIARSGPKREIYIVARERELYRLAPAVRRNLKPVIRPTMLDGGGPPTLYHLGPLRKN